jgi:hypothetical protein
MFLCETLNGKNGRAARAFPLFSLMYGPWYPALREFLRRVGFHTLRRTLSYSTLAKILFPRARARIIVAFRVKAAYCFEGL